MFTLTLQKKLTLSAATAIAIGGLLVTVLSYFSSMDRLNRDVQDRFQGTSSAYNNFVNNWFTAKGKALSAFSVLSSSSQMVNHLKQAKISAEFDNVFLAYADGSQKNANGVVLPRGNDDPRKWGWYKNALLQPSKAFIDNPTIAAATGANVVSIGKAVTLNNEQLVLGADVEITDILTQLNDVILPGKGYMFIATKQGKIFAHTNTKQLNKPVSAIEPELTDSLLASIVSSGGARLMEISGEKAYVYASPIKDSRLITVIVVDYNSVTAPIIRNLQNQALVTLVVVIVCVFIFNFVCRYIFIPLQEVSQALATIAQGGGDLSARIDINSHDEIGILAKNFNQFIASLQDIISHARSQAKQLDQRAHQSTEHAKTTFVDIDKQNIEISLVASALTQLTASTEEIAYNTENTAQAIEVSKEKTNQGRSLVLESRSSINELAKEVTEATTVINELQTHTQAINSILVTIQSIAEQTNLLALNAAIEAARAGEQGRGFSVVADEVRVLSQRTHLSTKEIQEMVNTIQVTTSNAVELMETSSSLAQQSVDNSGQASLSLEEISASVELISDMSGQIAVGAAQQSQVTHEIMENTHRIKDLSDTLASNANQSKSESQSLSVLSNDLNDRISAFVI